MSQRLMQQIVFPFTAYLLMFVGMGLVAGSIVHFGEVSQIYRFAAIGAVGMVMFSVGSYVQELHINPQKLPLRELLHYVLFSLLLAVGIGMMSGGTQHFLDFPRYASFLLPIGLLIALVAYILRNRIQMSWRAWNGLLAGVIAIALPLYLGLNHYAQSLPVGASGQGHHHGTAEVKSVAESSAQSHGPGKTEHSPMNHSPMNHAGAIANDIDFLSAMIPHHQEAVDTSAYLLTRTSDPALQSFLEGVIQVQSQEVNQMKQWYQQWTGKAYANNGSYQPMMGDLPKAEGAALEQAYLSGMVEHHRGAIAMAQHVQTITTRPELKQMATALINTQTQEVTQLEHWLGDRATDRSPHHH